MSVQKEQWKVWVGLGVCVLAFAMSKEVQADETRKENTYENEHMRSRMAREWAPRAALRPLRGLATRHGVSISLKPPKRVFVNRLESYTLFEDHFDKESLFVVLLKNENPIPVEMCFPTIEYRRPSGGVVSFLGVGAKDKGSTEARFGCVTVPPAGDDPDAFETSMLIAPKRGASVELDADETLRLASAGFWVGVPHHVGQGPEGAWYDPASGLPPERVRSVLQQWVVHTFLGHSITSKERVALNIAQKRNGVQFSLDKVGEHEDTRLREKYRQATQALCGMEQSWLHALSAVETDRHIQVLESFDNFAQHHPRFLGLSGCLVSRDFIHAARLAHASDQREVALRMVERLGDPEQMTAEQREIYAAVWSGRAQMYADDGAWALFLDAARKVHTADPEHRILQLRTRAFRALQNEAVFMAKKYSFVNASYITMSMERTLEQNQKRSPNDAMLSGLQKVYDETLQKIAWERGRYQFHVQIHEEGMMRVAEASFRKALPVAPFGARVYLAGLVFLEHQFKIIFSLVLLCLGGALFVRSDWVWRWRQERLLKKAQRSDAHTSRDRYWLVLNAVLGRSTQDDASEGLKARAAAGILESAREIGDGQEMVEASSYLHTTDLRARPDRWASPKHGLDHIVQTLLDGAESGEHVELEATTRIDVEILHSLFGETDCTRAARLVWDLALCAQGKGTRAALREATDSLRDVWEHGTLAQNTQDRLRLYTAWVWARVGPKLCDAHPEEAWAVVWDLWGQEVVERGILLGWEQDAPPHSSPASVFLAPAAMEGHAGLHAIRGDVEAALFASHACMEDVPTAIQRTQALHKRHALQHINPRVLEASLLTLARRATLPVSSDQETSRQALNALADLDNLLTAYAHGVACLEARLKLAILRWIGGQITGHAASDTEYEQDCAALFEEARDASHLPNVSALAAVLDVLTPGDWGFDTYARNAEGADQALFSLLRALDTMTRNQPIEAISALVDVDPNQVHNQDLRARFLSARAVVAAQLGQTDAALQALEKALLGLPEDSSETRNAVDRVTARLQRTLLEAASMDGSLQIDALTAELWASLARGALLLYTPPSNDLKVSWAVLGSVLARLGLWDDADAILHVSRTVEHDGDARVLRGHAYMLCASQALKRCDYTRARTYAILSENPQSHGRV